jgi:hypothetical protein
MNSVNPAIQMPPLARNRIDTNAVQIMSDWINSLGGTPALPPPTITPSAGAFQGFVNVTIQPPANNVTMYYTLDGSLPTTNSQLYTGPFMLANSATVNANAWEPGYIDSVVGVAQYTVLPGPFLRVARRIHQRDFPNVVCRPRRVKLRASSQHQPGSMDIDQHQHSRGLAVRPFRSKRPGRFVRLLSCSPGAVSMVRVLLLSIGLAAWTVSAQTNLSVRSEEIRNQCIQGRRYVCGRVLQVTPLGLVVDCGYPSLCNRRSTIPGSRAPTSLPPAPPLWWKGRNPIPSPSVWYF